jgi:hypothetical protein
MNEHLMTQQEFEQLLEEARAKDKSQGGWQQAVWFGLARRILRSWNGVSYDFVHQLTPGQRAVVCCAKFHANAADDLITLLSESKLPGLTLHCLDTLRADEYADLLRTIRDLFPGKEFPEYAEDLLKVYRKLPDDYFDKAAEKFVSAKGMRRPLSNYIWDYIEAHPEDFCRS